MGNSLAKQARHAASANDVPKLTQASRRDRSQRSGGCSGVAIQRVQGGGGCPRSARLAAPLNCPYAEPVTRPRGAPRTCTCNTAPAAAPQIVSSRGGQDALLRSSFWKSRTSLHCAARHGCAEALAAVIEVASHRPDAAEPLTAFLNAPDQHGDTALALACKHG